MVLDPLSALSTAAAVVQFIDFASTIVCKSSQLYRATSGLCEENAKTLTAVEWLEALIQAVENPLPPARHVTISKTAHLSNEFRLRYAEADGPLRETPNISFIAEEERFVHLSRTTQALVEQLAEIRTDIKAQSKSFYEIYLARDAEMKKSLKDFKIDYTFRLLAQGMGWNVLGPGKGCIGKSTLMKYIWDNKLTHDLLDIWAGSAAMVTGLFFLWSGGTVEQRSQTGLLRSLLHSVLKHQPSLICEVFRTEWDRKYRQAMYQAEIGTEEWSQGRLRTAFERLLTLANKDLKLCFFIDGLDEFEGHPGDIAEYMHNLACSSPWVKLCVSSRPWLVFQAVFRGAPSLQVQNLNRTDIQRYVESKLRNNIHLKLLSRFNSKNSRAVDELLKEIVRRASGVFLWVFLVVKSLIDGLRNGDQIEHLQTRLDTTPTEPSKIFQIFSASDHSLDVLTLSQAIRFSKLTDVLAMEVDPIATDGEIEQRLSELNQKLPAFWARINSRTMGLLEAPPAAWDSEYEHRYHWSETRNPLFMPQGNRCASREFVIFIEL
ncbi:hypothetical protein GGR58DRAFT_502955 [Xylaria digitata]|nr:hypothetical protein GGR58DRAFT_502955 [Xylaria digitata]